MSQLLRIAGQESVGIWIRGIFEGSFSELRRKQAWVREI